MEDGRLVFHRELCSRCGACGEVCYAGAIEVCGRTYSVEDVLGEVLQDRAYYESSGGGVTLSGGEVLTQPDFAFSLLTALPEKGISTALETNLRIPERVIRRMLPVTDLWMCDLKLRDGEAHRKWTGAGNSAVLANLSLLSREGAELIVRTPVIPGVNDREEEIGAIAEFLRELRGLRYYELLNFNPLGGSKYKALGMDDPFAGAKPLPRERMEALRDEAEKTGIPVRIK